MKKAFWKSKTLWGLTLMILVSFPDATSGFWFALLDAGAPPEWVARGQVAAYLIGWFLALYGRLVADKPLGVKNRV